MNQSNLLEQARQGEPSAIATLMNAALIPKGVTARVDVEGDCLYVMFESTQSLNPDTLMRFIYRGLEGLETGLVKRVKLYEQKIGENTISWKREFIVGAPLEIPVALAQGNASIVIDDATKDITTQPELDHLIDQVEIDQVDVDISVADGETAAQSEPDLGKLTTTASHSPIKNFWRKYPLPFVLMVGFAFISGGGAALLMSTSQRPTSADSSPGKQQEAETYLRDMNEAQRAFYSQNNRFATSLEELERSANMFSKAYYYTYKLETTKKEQAKITAVPKEPGLKSYVGAVFVNATQVTPIICRTQQPVEIMLPLPTWTNNQPHCPVDSTPLP